MKKMLSLAAMFAVLSYASPASAELKIGGDASVRARGEFNYANNDNNPNDDLYYQYRLRLTGAADLGDGYFFKTLIMNEDATNSKLSASGWRTVGGTTLAGTIANGDANTPYSLAVSQLYFGRNTKDCNYSIGRIPLNSFNNPIFDLALYPTQPLDTPVNNLNYDRLFGASYGTSIGSGKLSATLVVLDNKSTSVSTAVNDGLLNDGYALSLVYNTTVGQVTIEPQVFAMLNTNNAAKPLTFGSTFSTPINKSKVSLGGFYTTAKDSNADLNGYLIRVKGETGPFMAWFDYNKTNDNKNATDYTNTFVWTQYKYIVQQSAAGSFTLQPTLRWRTSTVSPVVAPANSSNGVVRPELWATVAF